MNRQSFQELVLDDEGRVRWQRIENLVQESAKSAIDTREQHDQTGAQLWLVAQWLLGDAGKGLRRPLVAELARLLDSTVAGAGFSTAAVL